MIQKAFILGAGLGTRLRPLTEKLPKPLVPLYHRPLAAWAVDACIEAGIRDFAVNTHHLPAAWESDKWGIPSPFWEDSPYFGKNGLRARRGKWGGADVTRFEEPDLLETGGGIKNIADWIGEDDVLVHNGDIFTNLSLPDLIKAHESSGNVLSLALRSQGTAKHIAWEDGRVTDIRNRLGHAEGAYVFSGIYCFSPEFLSYIPAGEKISVIPSFLELIEEGRVGGVLLDEGAWYDLGDVPSYLAAHQELHLAAPIHPRAIIAEDAIVRNSVIGADVIIEPGARLIDSVVWSGAKIHAGEVLEKEVRMPEEIQF